MISRKSGYDGNYTSFVIQFNRVLYHVRLVAGILYLLIISVKFFELILLQSVNDCSSVLNIQSIIK